LHEEFYDGVLERLRVLEVMHAKDLPVDVSFFPPHKR